MAIDLYAMLRDHGVPAIDKRAGSDHSSASFNPKFMVCHHTASPAGSGDVPSLSIVRFGRGGPNPVPGPLSQLVLGRAGTTIVVTDGRANHPGMCDIEMINRAVQGLAPNRPPGDDDSGANASSKAYGIEAENNGVGEPWPNVQLERYIQICEAFCSEFGWGPGHFWGHKEITRRKIDPSFDMRWFRGEINASSSPQQPKEWDEMASKKEIEDVVKESTDPIEAKIDALTVRLDSLAVGSSYMGHQFDGVIPVMKDLDRHVSGAQNDDNRTLRSIVESIFNKVK